MKKTSFYLLLFLGFIITIVPQQIFAQEEQRYIVLFEDQVNEQIVEDAGAVLVESVKHSPIAVVQADEETISVLQEVEAVKSIEIDTEVEIAAQQSSWGMETMNVSNAWRTGYTGKGVKIGVIDSGIGPHEDIRVVERISFIDSDPSIIDFNGHGTHVAGIIGALDNEIGVKGIAPEAELYALKVFNEQGIGYTSDIIRAIDWAIENEIDIINLSLTSKTGLPSYEQILNRAYEKGILIVAAAGNATSTDITADTVEFPARYESVIAVSSINEARQKGYLSAIGPSIEVAAPGEDIYSTFTGNTYRSLSGTSLAAAFVTGQLALLKEAYPALNNIQLRKKLVDDTIDLAPKGRDPVFGYGMIQVGNYHSPLYEYPAKNNPVVSLSFSEKVIAGEVNTTVPVRLMARLKNNEVVDVSDFARWSTENSEVMTIRGGRIDLHKEGKTRVYAAYSNLIVEMPVEVVSASTPEKNPPRIFKDLTEDYWALEEIQAMQAKFIITGYENDTFQPGNPIQRQHVAAMIARAIQLEQKLAIRPFADVFMSSPYFYDITRAQQAGIIGGSEKGFAPNDVLTRGQMAKIIVEAFELPKEGRHPFPDVAKTHWANEYVTALYQADITTGSDGQFKPERSVSRAEFAVFLQRALSK